MIKTRAMLVLLAVVGCGGAGGPGGGNVPREKYNEEAYKAICAHYATCGIAKSADTCNQYFQSVLAPYLSLGTSLYDKAIELGKIKYDGAAASRCLTGYSTASCSLAGLITPASDCRSVYVGQVPVGSSCGFGQCVPSAFCSSELDQKCPGTCKARVQAGGMATSPVECAIGLVIISGACSQPTPEGSSCSSPTTLFSTCAPGLACASDTKTCTKPRVAGEACSSTMACDIFYQCLNGKCAPPGDVGASCGQPSGGGLSCKLELSCKGSGTTAVCAERLAEGSVCTGADCGFNLRCSKASATATENTCHKPLALNQSCSGAMAADCDTNLYCNSAQTCVTQLADGAACMPGEVCSLGACTNGKCVSYLSSICF